MIPQPGQHVKCFMRSTMVLEGIVENWSDTQVVLKSLDGENLMIVHRPVEDILITKVILGESLEISKEKIPEPISEIKQQITKKLQEVLESNHDQDPEIDKMNLDQLRQLVIASEQEIISEKKKEHFGNPGAAKRAVPYSNIISYLPKKG